MSSLKLKHSGGNSVIIAGPSSNPAADRTINLNDNYAGNGSFVTANSSGNVGINKSNPSYPFVVRRTDASGIISEFANSSGYGLLIGQASASGEAYLRTGTGQALAFKTNGDNERMRVLAGGGLTFNGDTASANALNDYEEGSWTPALYEGSSVTVHSASYTKIGKLCNVSAYVTIASNSSSSVIRFNSLPFVAANVGYSIGSAYTQTTGSNHIFTQIDGNSSNITVYKNDGTSITQSSLSGAYVLFSGTYRTT